MPYQLTQGYKDLRGEFTLMFGDGDEWGTTLSFWFAVAEVAYHAGTVLPSHWEFRDSPVHEDDWRPEDYPGSIVQEMYDAGEVTEADLISFGNVVTRYANLLKMAGKDY